MYWYPSHGETIYGTDAGDVKPQKWGVSTKKDDKLYLHITALEQIEKDEKYLPSLQVHVIVDQPLQYGTRRW